VIGVTLLDYGMGNLHSLAKALAAPGVRVRIETDPAAACDTDRLVLPGVGAFAPAALHLAPHRTTLRRALENGLPCLGICLGMQLLLDASEEDGEHAGLGVVPGRVVRFRPTDHALKVPHMGWNTLILRQSDHPMFVGLPADPRVYFVHSYLCAPADPSVVAADADYGGRFCAAIARANVFATQFHPEKSGPVGLRLLANFVSICAAERVA